MGKNIELNKIENLEKIKKLKDSGAITEEEYNAEKEKILNMTNSTTNSKRKISLVFFITSGLLLVLTISFIILTFIWSNKTDSARYDGYLLAELNLQSAKEYKEKHYSVYAEKWYREEKEKFEKEEKKYKKVENKYKFFKYASIVSGSLCVISLGSGIILYKRKKE